MSDFGFHFNLQTLFDSIEENLQALMQFDQKIILFWFLSYFFIDSFSPIGGVDRNLISLQRSAFHSECQNFEMRSNKKIR